MTRSRLLVALATALVPAAATVPVAAAAPGGDPLDAVNTFIGTQDEGNTFPRASAPFGTTQVSPTAESTRKPRRRRTRASSATRSTVPGPPTFS